MAEPRSPSTRRRLYGVHSGTGAVLGVVLFVVCATGTITVLRDELRAWANPHLWSLGAGQALPAGALDRALEVFAGRFDLASGRIFALRLPSAASPAIELIVQREKGRGLIHAFVDPRTGDYLGETRSELGDFFFQLHSNFSLSSKVGRYLVGLAGLAMCVLIVTGVSLHGRILRDLFRMRRTSMRVLLADLHKGLGTWGLLFHLLIAWSGVSLALKDLLILAPAATVYEGDLTAARSQLAQAPVVRTGRVAAMASVDAMLRASRDGVAAFEPTMIVFHVWGDEAGRVDVGGGLPGALLPHSEAARVHFDAASGRMVEVEDGRQHGAPRRVLGAMTPLHYGNFGGGAVRWLYFLFGTLATALTWTGLQLWLQRMARAERRGLDAG